MLESARRYLLAHGIDCVGAVSLSRCHITRRYLLERCGFSDTDGLVAIIFAIPYLTACEEKNISAYAVGRDYHFYCRELFDDILPLLRSAYPDYKFEGFADHSPIDEIHAAALAGLGVLGQNRLLITEKYSSYVFLAEIVTDAPIKTSDDSVIRHCEECGLCLESCPMTKCGMCLSALTQKKGELTEDEKRLITQYSSAWGCDICQETCPHTKKAMNDGTIYTEIEFFKSESMPRLTTDMIDSMSEEDFKTRAYSWRGKDTIRRNLLLLEQNKEN